MERRKEGRKDREERRGKGKVLPFWRAGRRVCARERVEKAHTVNMAIWKEGGERRGQKGDDGGRRRAEYMERAGRVEERRKEEDVMCTTAAVWRGGVSQ